MENEIKKQYIEQYTEVIQVIGKLETIEDIKDYINQLKPVEKRIWVTADFRLQKLIENNSENYDINEIKKAIIDDLKKESEVYYKQVLDLIKKYGDTEQEYYNKITLQTRQRLPDAPPLVRDREERFIGLDIQTDDDKQKIKELSKLLKDFPTSEFPLVSLKENVNNYLNNKDLNDSASNIDTYLYQIVDLKISDLKPEKNKELFDEIAKIQKEMQAINEKQGEEQNFKEGKTDLRGKSWSK